MQGEFTVRVALANDERLVSELLAASYPDLMATNYEEKVLKVALPRMTQANPALLKSGTFYVAQTQDYRVIGCGGWTFERPGSGEVDPQLAHIRHFATHPEWLRQGVGRAIYSRCEAEAVAAGAREFECFASLNAQEFYGSLGFIAVNQIKVSMGPDVTFPAALMKRPISAIS
jgi:N-acetylglutamate synthase-like GNAT family acetyltransferase